MTIISYNLTGNIEPAVVAILSEVDKHAQEMGIPFFVIGATARDILIQHAHNIFASRSTVDVDIGVSVSDWNQLQVLKEALIGSGLFMGSKVMHRLLYKSSFPLDIIPFGKIASEDGSISWPPEHDIEMSIVGFQDCHQHSISVLIDAVKAMVDANVDAILFNCCQPEVIGKAIETTRRRLASLGAGEIEIGAYANAFAPQTKDARANEELNELRTDLTPASYLDWIRQWIREGATLIGGCCGIGPEHIVLLSEKLTSDEDRGKHA